MKNLLLGLFITCVFLLSESAMAWDGFDASSADLVEIIPDKIPAPGDNVEVRFYESENTLHCIVETVTRNRMTIEVMVREPSGATRILVMEGR